MGKVTEVAASHVPVLEPDTSPRASPAALVKAIRSGNLELYVPAVTALSPWTLSLDHHNCAKWLPVYIR